LTAWLRISLLQWRCGGQWLLSPNLESKSGATFPLLSGSSTLPSLGSFSSLWGKVLLRVLIGSKNRRKIVNGVNCSVKTWRELLIYTLNKTSPDFSLGLPGIKIEGTGGGGCRKVVRKSSYCRKMFVQKCKIRLKGLILKKKSGERLTF